MRKSRLFMFLLKVLFSAGVLAFLIYHIDLAGMYNAVGKTKIWYLMAGLVIYPLSQIICAAKWQYIGKALGIQKDLKPLVRLYFIGMFFNLFLPTSIGGDITRSLYMDPESGNTRRSFLSVFVERATGVLSMLALASIVMLSPAGAPLPAWLRFGFPAASLLAYVVLWFLPRIVGKTRTKIRQWVCEDLSIFWEKPGITVAAIAYSAVFHTLLICIHILIASALSLNVPAVYHFITMSLGSLSSFLPSLNGVGVRDASYIYLLGRVGVDGEHAFLFSILWFLTMVVSGLIGCLVYLVRGVNPGAALQDPEKTQRHEDTKVAREI